MIVVLMGVSGSGKTSVGLALAELLGWAFVEADDFHSIENVEKMRSGTPLNDDDRRPWLRVLREWINAACIDGESAVMACSSEELIRRRLDEREGHFMDSALLQSQFDALEPPEGAIRVDVTPVPEVIAAEIRRHLERR